jgi:hypothetical protein
MIFCIHHDGKYRKLFHQNVIPHYKCFLQAYWLKLQSSKNFLNMWLPFFYYARSQYFDSFFALLGIRKISLIHTPRFIHENFSVSFLETVFFFSFKFDICLKIEIGYDFKNCLRKITFGVWRLFYWLNKFKLKKNSY